MPIYEFCCTSCKHKFEEIMTVDSDYPLCPKCKSPTYKLVSRFSGVVRGSEHRLLDCVVGEDAERRWGYLEERRKRRERQKKGNKRQNKESKNVLVNV